MSILDLGFGCNCVISLQWMSLTSQRVPLFSKCSRKNTRRREWMKGRLPNMPIFRSPGKTELPPHPPVLSTAPRGLTFLIALVCHRPPPSPASSHLLSPRLTVYILDPLAIISTVEWRLLCPQFGLWQIKQGTITCYGSEASWRRSSLKGEDNRINMVTPSCWSPKVPLNCSILSLLFLIYFF